MHFKTLFNSPHPQQTHFRFKNLIFIQSDISIMFCSINCLTDDQVMMKIGLKPCFQECNNHQIHVNETHNLQLQMNNFNNLKKIMTYHRIVALNLG